MKSRRLDDAHMDSNRGNLFQSFLASCHPSRVWFPVSTISLRERHFGSPLMGKAMSFAVLVNIKAR